MADPTVYEDPFGLGEEEQDQVAQPTVAPTVSLPEPAQAAPVAAPKKFFDKPSVSQIRRELQEEKLSLILKQASETNPEDRAAVQRLARETGIPVDLVGLDPIRIQREWSSRRARQRQMATYDPVVAEQLSNPEFAKIAHDDIDNLTMTEKVIKGITTLDEIPTDIGTGWRLSWLTNERGRIGLKSILKTATPEDMERKKVIDDTVDALSQRDLGVWGNAGLIAASATDVVANSATLGAVASVAAGGTALVLGQLGPQAALPEEVITVPVAMGRAFWMATQAGAALESFQIAAGNSYYDMRENGIDEATAQYAAAGVGVVSAGLEVVGLRALADPIKKEIIRRTTVEISKKLTAASSKSAAAAGANAYVKAWAGETATEISQDFVAMLGQDLAAAISPNEVAVLITTPQGRAEYARRLADTAVNIGQGMLVVALPGGVISYRGESKRAAAAESERRFIEDLGVTIDNSKVRKRNPEAYQKFMEAQLDGTPVQNIYVNAVQFENVLNQMGITVEQLEDQIPGITEQMEAQKIEQDDVVIPTAVYAAKISGTEFGNTLRDHMRLQKDSMSVTEAVAFKGVQEEMRVNAETIMDEKRETDKQFNIEATEVRDIVLEQLKTASDKSPTVKRTYANYIRDFVVTNAPKMGMSPKQFYDRYRYTIVGPQQAAQVAAENTLSQSVTIGERSIPVTINKVDEKSGESLATVNVAQFEENFQGSPSFYVGPQGQGGIEGRYERFAEFQKTAESIEAPSVAVDENGSVTFGNGRHRYAFMRDNGVQQMPMAMDAASLANAKKFGYVSETATSDADILNQRAQKPQATGKPVPVSVNAVSGVEANFEFAATKPFATNRAFKLEIQKRVQDAAKAAGVNLEEFSLGVEQYLVQSTLADALVALRTNPNAVGWYNEKVTKALNVLALVHPELATDPEAKFAFTWALAATSNGLKVNDNFKLAEQSYRAYKESSADPAQRRMPTNIQAGTAQKAINGAMKIYNDLIARDGFEVVEQFMTTMHTAKEVAAYTKTKVSGESPTTMVYGAAAIGPKIGNGFFANLYGHFEQLTMDRWLMRTWGRWTGTLVEDNKANIKIKREQLKTLIRTLSSAEKKSFEAILKIKMTLSNIDAVGVAIKKRSMLPANRELMNAIGFSKEAVAKLETLFGVPSGNEKRVGLGDQLRKVGNSLAGYLDGQKEAPSGAVERGQIRKVFQQALILLQQDHPSLTMADLQALLWYPEKRLYDAAKTKDEDADAGYEDDAAPDYANAAASLARSKGVSEEAINQTTKEVDDGIRANTISTGTPQRGAGELFEQARNGGGRYSAGSLAPLEGAPTVSGATGPDIRLVSVAERYAAASGIDLKRQSEYVRVNIDLARRISDAYEQMPNDPQNPVVAEAYQNLINQTKAQYQALVDAGYEFYFIDENNGADYLSSPFNAVRELRQDQRMGVYPTEAGFGQEGGVADGGVSNPMLADTGLVWMDADGNSKRVLANDLFRAVHDAFGHSLEGAGFRAQGEENAWQAHVRLFTGSAIAAMTSETRGQNSWLHFGPNGEANTGASVADTVFAEQKTGLMPEFTWTENRSGDQETMEQLNQQSQQGPRGGFDPQRLTTMLNTEADYSTFLHETAHFFLSVYSDMSMSPDASPQSKADMQQILDWFGVKDVETWNGMSLDQQRKYHEQFAYNFEIYLFEGKAPSIELQPMFAKFKAFLKEVYRSIRDELNVLYRQENGRDLPILTDEIRSVMDRMLATESAISKAEQVAGMMPMFETQEQSGMDDARWAAYQSMIEEAHEVAVSDLDQASVRQVKWLDNALSKVIKALQKEASAARKKVSEEVTEEVKNLPIYRLMDFLKRGMMDGAGVDFKVKLAIDQIELMYGKGEMLDSIRKKFGFGQYGMLGKEQTIHPEQAAEMFGFPSAYAMVQDLLNARPMKEEISARTDQRMLEENSELNDEKAMAAKANELVHNEARARFIAVELRFLSKMNQPVRAMTAAAKQVAKKIVSAKQIRQLKPRDHTLAEASAARRATAASKKGQSLEAAKEKQTQLVQNHLVKETIAAKQEVAKAIDMFRKIFKADKKLTKTRNMDIVNATRSILAAYGLGKSDKAPSEYTKQLRQYDPELYAQMESMIMDASAGGKDITMLTMEQFRELRDFVEALWYQSSRDKMVDIEGQKIELAQVSTELTDRLMEIGLPENPVGSVQAPTKWENIGRYLNTGKNILRRVEHWANATDGPKGIGPFTKYIFRPMAAATDKYREQRNIYTRRFADLVSGLDLPVAKLRSETLNYTFGGNNGGIGKAELIGAMLHIGNPSNFKKLLLGGRGEGFAWGSLREDGSLDTTKWDAFISEMEDKGIITKKDYDFLQSVWDLTEEMKPIAQKAHKEMFGYYFAEVDAVAVETKFGSYKGGYVPAKVDPMIVGDASRNAKMEDLEADFRQSMPSTGMGFTKGRVDYNKALDLDVRKMTAHIDGVLRFANIQPVVRDTLKILRDRKFSDALNAIDPGAIEEMLLPWLVRAASQSSGVPGLYKGMDKFWQAVRNRTGVSIMFGNLVNGLQQFTGHFVTMLQVQPKYIKSAQWDYMKRPSQVAKEVSEMSPFMANRLENQIFDIQETLNDLLLNPNAFRKAQKWVDKHGYFLQQSFQNQVDLVSWTASYNQAMEAQGVEVTAEAAHKEAVKRADATVRMTQDSLAAEDIARVQAGTPFFKTLMQFTGYFNMLLNVNASEYTKLYRDVGLSKSKAKLFYTYLMGFALPMLMADAIVRTFGGQWDDEDDDGYLDEIGEWFFMSQIRGATAMIPILGPNVAVVFNATNDKPYDDRATTSPSVSALENATVGVTKAVISVAKGNDVSGKNVRDVLTLLSISTKLPFTIFGRPLSYAVDVENKRIKPSSDADYIRGLVSGKASEGTR